MSGYMRAIVATAARTLRVGKSELPTLDTSGNLKVTITGSGGAAAAAAADATANPTLGGMLTYLLGFNGTTWDRLRTGIVAKTATFTGLLDALVLGRYNATPPTLTDGDAQLLQVDSVGSLRTSEQNVVGWNFSHITAATTTVVKASAGVLHSVVVGTLVAAATITIYDNTSAAGTVIAIITLPAAGAGDMPETVLFDVTCTTGITVVTSGATDLTVAFL